MLLTYVLGFIGPLRRFEKRKEAPQEATCVLELVAIKGAADPEQVERLQVGLASATLQELHEVIGRAGHVGLVHGIRVRALIEPTASFVSVPGSLPIHHEGVGFNGEGLEHFGCIWLGDLQAHRGVELLVQQKKAPHQRQHDTSPMATRGLTMSASRLRRLHLKIL
jgi:hypothetical protein